jgi:hypothetical protein
MIVMTPRTKPRAPAHRPTWLGRCRAGLRWLVPATLLALMPKCPVCLAGYVALFTGVGLSLTAASLLRTGLIFACAAALAWFAGREFRAWLARRKRAA